MPELFFVERSHCIGYKRKMNHLWIDIFGTLFQTIGPWVTHRMIHLWSRKVINVWRVPLVQKIITFLESNISIKIILYQTRTLFCYTLNASRVMVDPKNILRTAMNEGFLLLKWVNYQLQHSPSFWTWNRLLFLFWTCIFFKFIPLSQKVLNTLCKAIRLFKVARTVNTKLGFTE